MKKIYVVRHGMRLDHEDKSWRQTAARPFDSPLSPTGFTQAYETGLYLRTRQIRAVYASPLLRTIQTATEIVKTLDLDIQVEGGLAEWLNPKWYDFSAGMLPLETLLPDHPRLNTAYEPLVRPRYPEHEEAVCFGRCSYVARQLSHEQEGAILLVTHGIGVMGIIQTLTGQRQGISDKTCAVNVLGKTLSGWALEEATTAHLSSERQTQFI